MSNHDEPKTCEECKYNTTNYDAEVCEECCDHGDMDDCFCLICNADRTEDMMAAAYDAAKDRMKYGD